MGPRGIGEHVRNAIEHMTRKKPSAETVVQGLLAELGTADMRDALIRYAREKESGTVSEEALDALLRTYLNVEKKWVDDGLEQDPRHQGWKDEVNILLREGRLLLAQHGKIT